MMVANNESTAINGNIIRGHIITLNIYVPNDNIIQSMQFDNQMLIADICRNIQKHLSFTIAHDRKINFSYHEILKYNFDI